MRTGRTYRVAALMVGVATPLLAAGIASATPPHEGDPAVWGPPLAALCAGANPAGYNVITGGPMADVLIGGPGPDLILAMAGNDTVRGRGGPDVICLGLGNDRGRGGAGNDAIFGEWHNDLLLGDGGLDYLDGGPQTDTCNGGTPFGDVASGCESTLNVP